MALTENIRDNDLTIPSGQQRPGQSEGAAATRGGVHPFLRGVIAAAERVLHAPGRPLSNGETDRHFLRHAQEESI